MFNSGVVNEIIDKSCGHINFIASVIIIYGYNVDNKFVK